MSDGGREGECQNEFPSKDCMSEPIQYRSKTAEIPQEVRYSSSTAQQQRVCGMCEMRKIWKICATNVDICFMMWRTYCSFVNAFKFEQMLFWESVGNGVGV